MTSCADPYTREMPDEANINFEVEIIVDTTNINDPGIIHSAYDLEVANNRLYVADNILNKILVYSKTGDFIHSFGERGRGPGEFTAIKSFAVFDSVIFVYDQNLKRINKFSLQGDFMESVTLETPTSIIDMYEINNNYLLFRPNVRGYISLETIGYLYDDTFNELSEVIKINEVNDGIEEVIDAMLARPGKVVTLSEDSLAYVPYVYSGNIYLYTRIKKEKWSYSGREEGYIRSKPISVLEDTSGRKPDFSVTGTSGESEHYILHNTSRGLIKHGNYILHFTVLDDDSTRIFGVEAYNSSLDLIGYEPIKEIPISDNEHNDLYWDVEDIDKEGFLYMRQRFLDKNKSRIAKMEVDITKY